MVQLSRHAQTHIGTDNVARVEQRHRRRKVAGVLEEKGTQLREEYGVSLVHGELRLIAFNVAEVRIDGAVKNDRIVPNRLHFASARCFGIACAEVGIVGIKRIQRVFVLRKGVGVYLNIVRACDAFDSA